ncbi:MAG: hypothetical protein HW416_2373 [Chloroflexi bacterium]|nr:hypothetical protein [Chloroflexota bacterium]
MSGIRLYTGTAAGLFVWEQMREGWKQVASLDRRPFLWAISGAQGDPERVYAASSDDGLYRTEDAGRSWSRVLVGNVRSVTVDPSDDDVVYAGTDPVHLYRSEDRGATWKELRHLTDLPPDVTRRWRFPVPPEQGHILNIFIHPDEPTTIYLCIEHGGVVRSFDRGETWEDVSEGLLDYPDMHMVASLPHSFDRYYVSSARGFFTSADPGRGWVRAENGFTRDYYHDFVFLAPADGESRPTMLVATADKSPGSWDRPEHARSAVFRSTDCAESWHRVGNGLPELMEEGIWGFVRNPANQRGAFLGLGRIYFRDHARPCGAGGVFATSDGGESWERIPIELAAVRALYAAAN